MMIYKEETGHPISSFCLQTLFYAVLKHQDIFFKLNHKACKFNLFKACSDGDAVLKISQISSQKARTVKRIQILLCISYFLNEKQNFSYGLISWCSGPWPCVTHLHWVFYTECFSIIVFKYGLCNS